MLNVIPVPLGLAISGIKDISSSLQTSVSTTTKACTNVLSTTFNNVQPPVIPTKSMRWEKKYNPVVLLVWEQQRLQSSSLSLYMMEDD